MDAGPFKKWPRLTSLPKVLVLQGSFKLAEGSFKLGTEIHTQLNG